MNQHWIDDQPEPAAAARRLRRSRRTCSGSAARSGCGRLQQMVIWGMGPAFGITAWLGVVVRRGLRVAEARRGVAGAARVGAGLLRCSWARSSRCTCGTSCRCIRRSRCWRASCCTRRWTGRRQPEPFAALGRLGERAVAHRKPALPRRVRAARRGVAVFTALGGPRVLQHLSLARDARRSVEWMYENVPGGLGHRSRALGRRGAVRPARAYASRKYDLGSHVRRTYDDGFTREASTQLLNNLDQVDYIMLASARLSGTIPRVPAVWPVTSRYYDALDDPASSASRRWRSSRRTHELFGREFDDTGAEESFSVYDHPRVVVYEKTDDYSHEKARGARSAPMRRPLPATCCRRTRRRTACCSRRTCSPRNRRRHLDGHLQSGLASSNRFPLISSGCW